MNERINKASIISSTVSSRPISNFMSLFDNDKKSKDPILSKIISEKEEKIIKLKQKLI